MSTSEAVPPSPRANAPVSSETDSRASARRRQVAVAENNESLTNLATLGSEERPEVNGRDLSRSLRGETILGLSRDPRLISRRLIPHKGSPRPKRSVHRVEKPKWLTIISILTKNAILLMVLFWLGQAMWRWNYGHVPSSDAPFVALELENRVSEVEALLRKTAAMTQVQLDVMEQRTKKTEERAVNIEKDMRNFVSRTDDLDKFLGELRDASFLSKKEFEVFVNELKKIVSESDRGKGFGLDDISHYAREAVIKEIEKHAADGLGRVDYALFSGGARVLKHSETYSSGKAGSWLPVKRGWSDVHTHAQKMLEPSFGEPGQCFALKGNNGYVVIKLRAGIIPDAITLEHVAKSVAYDRSSAPRDCRVWGWFEGPEDDPVGEYEKMALLKEFTYDLNTTNAQTFDIEMAPATIVNMVRLEFGSNHGSSSHTCIYRFRVHGYEPNLLPKGSDEAQNHI